MRLISKLTLFITLSKLAIVILFVALLPFLVEKIAFKYTNYYLHEQKKKVLKVIENNGIDYYLQGESSYGSYTMLKEEYIALEPLEHLAKIDTIETTRRIVEQDTLDYRVLSYAFIHNKKSYLLEVGKTNASIYQYNRSLQWVALYVLIGLIGITIVVDLMFTRYLLAPLNKIINTKLVNRKFPFKEKIPPVKTSTYDFKYLDNSFISLMDQIHEAFEKEREFTSNASHELMTPISILQSKIENLVIDPDTTEQQQVRMVEMMRTLARLKKIVQSLLLISRIENLQFAKVSTVKVSSLIDEVVEELSHRIEERAVDLKINLKEGITLSQVNQDLLFQLFYNLINNAIVYNMKVGAVLITDELVPGHHYTITITDTGIGIPAEELDSIFNRFKRVHHGDAAGYGLGLAIVKTILDFHNIEIKICSKINEGTSISLLIPFTLLHVNQ